MQVCDMLVNPNPMWLTHSVTVEKRIGENKFKDPEYGEPIQLNNVRMDRSFGIKRFAKDAKETPEAVVFIYPFIEDSIVFDETWLDARITDDKGKMYTIVKVIPNYQDVGDDIYSWELEVN